MKTFFKIRQKSTRKFWSAEHAHWKNDGTKFDNQMHAENEWAFMNRKRPRGKCELVEFRVVEVGATEIKK